MDPQAEDNPLRRRAEELYAAVEVPDVDALCRQHPELEGELRQIEQQHREASGIQAALPSPIGSLSFFGVHDPAPDGLPTSASAGQVLGDFRLLALIGRGGMGQVWEAEQISLSRRVAIKLVRPDRVTPRAMELFSREARAGGRLIHEGIVLVLAHGQEGNLAWIAMELVEGTWSLRNSLDQFLQQEELPATYYPDVARFTALVADALQAAHEAGVIHRDLKPQNILITPDELPKVTDFGLARITDESAISASGDVAGTYLYMSPEQVRGAREDSDHRTDIFSLGVVLYEMLALRRPFEGDTSHQVAQQILHVDPPNLRSVRSRVPRELALICNRALEKDPARRYASMRELAEDLRRYLRKEPIHARPPTPLDHALKWIRRHPSRASAALVAALAFLVISGLGLQLWRSNNDLAELNGQLRDKSAESQRNAEEARRKAIDVMRLSLSQEYDDLREESEQLWPAHPVRMAALREWITEGDRLVQELPELIVQRDELARQLQAPLAGTGGGSAHSEARWWHEQLTELVGKLELLSEELALARSNPGTPAGGRWTVPDRLAFAEGLAARYGPGGEYAARWARELPHISADYPDLELPVQLGLVPIGRDPQSNLWEFWDVQSGHEPRRDGRGRLVLEENSGLVFVLIPGGQFWMGAQPSEPGARNFDPQAEADEAPVHRVQISPFFLSKYEMNQGQWQRLSGSNPSYYDPAYIHLDYPHTLLHPVEQVTWSDCARLLPRFGWTLPTEAQWEYAARAGTSTPWWTGSERETLRTQAAANIADQAAAREKAQWPAILDWPDMDDGFVLHAPVDTLTPNGFGLHHIHGNLWEWCADGYDPDSYKESAGLDPVGPTVEVQRRVLRGGSFSNAAVSCRVANRYSDVPSFVRDYLGVRPARAVQR